MSTTFATITLELSKAGIHAYCEDIDEDCFCTDGNLKSLVKLIQDAEICCNPDTRFSLSPRKASVKPSDLRELQPRITQIERMEL